MRLAVAELVRRVIEREGGVKDIGDGKGLTRWGQTLGWLSQFNLPAPVNQTEAAENYAEWLRLTRLDAIIGEEPDVASDEVIDFAVHSGHYAAIKALQTALGVTPDGTIGPKTLAALAAVNRSRLAVAVIAAEMKYQGGLITGQPNTYAQWAKGWANRNAEKLIRIAESLS